MTKKTAVALFEGEHIAILAVTETPKDFVKEFSEMKGSKASKVITWNVEEHE